MEATNLINHEHNRKLANNLGKLIRNFQDAKVIQPVRSRWCFSERNGIRNLIVIFKKSNCVILNLRSKRAYGLFRFHGFVVLSNPQIMSILQSMNASGETVNKVYFTQLPKISFNIQVLERNMSHVMKTYNPQPVRKGCLGLVSHTCSFSAVIPVGFVSPGMSESHFCITLALPPVVNTASAERQKLVTAFARLLMTVFCFLRMLAWSNLARPSEAIQWHT